MLKPSRSLAYAVYSLLTLAAFAVSDAYPGDVTTGVATNLLAGFVIVLLVESLFRLAEDRRAHPMKIAAFKTNALVRARLETFLTDIYMTARGASLVTREQEASLDRIRLDPRLADIFARTPLNKSRSSAGFGLTGKAVIEVVDEAFDKYGTYQEPETAAWLATIHGLAAIRYLMTVHEYGWNLPHIEADNWMKAIEAHNHLASILERDANRYGIENPYPLEFFKRSERILWKS